jgi:UDP-N-acetylglucosamine:LPS N-acetylglucosamine transferase
MWRNFGHLELNHITRPYTTEFLESKGAGVWLKATDNPDEVIDSIFKDENTLIKMKENAIKLAKKKSTQEICDTLLK